MASNKDIDQILETFVHTVNASLEETLTLRDLKHLLKCSYNMHYTKPKQVTKDNNKPKKPRKPTKYNLFVKDTMAQLKIDKPTMPAQDKMKEIGRLWREYKEEHPHEFEDNTHDDTHDDIRYETEDEMHNNF